MGSRRRMQKEGLGKRRAVNIKSTGTKMIGTKVVPVLINTNIALPAAQTRTSKVQAQVAVPSIVPLLAVQASTVMVIPVRAPINMAPARHQVNTEMGILAALAKINTNRAAVAEIKTGTRIKIDIGPINIAPPQINTNTAPVANIHPPLIKIVIKIKKEKSRSIVQAVGKKIVVRKKMWILIKIRNVKKGRIAREKRRKGVKGKNVKDRKGRKKKERAKKVKKSL